MNYITKWFATGPRSVETIVGNLRRTVAELEAHAIEHAAHATAKLAESVRLQAEAIAHSNESNKATTVGSKIGSLLSA